MSNASRFQSLLSEARTPTADHRLSVGVMLKKAGSALVAAEVPLESAVGVGQV